MRKLVRIFFVFIVFLQISVLNIFATESDTTYYFFYGQGCGHCAKVERFLRANNMYENYSIELKEIYFNEDNRNLYTKMLDERNVPISGRGVPTLVYDDQVLVGDKPIINYFSSHKENEPSTQEVEIAQENSSLTMSLIVGASLVDAINPCAFAVLIILMSTLLSRGNKDKKKLLYSGLAFSSSIFISYLLMGLGLYKAIASIQNSVVIFTIVGMVAIVLGLLNIKDFFFYGKGILMEVPLSWRPRLKKVIGSVMSVKAAFVIGFLVSLFLLPCTSGPYIVILGMLSQKVYTMKALGYLILYNAIFVSPMVLLTVLFYKGLCPEKIEQVRQKRLRVLHLVAGLILIIMGIVVLTN